MKDQLTLFGSSGNPLEERLKADFFDTLPKNPGVYKMYGRAGRLLYVGKAKNLRSRLFTYRRVTSDHRSRKTRQLVGMVRTIEYDICESEEAALLKENAIIRNRRPVFNRAKKSPETYYYLSLKPGKDRYRFRLAMRLPGDAAMLTHTYGAFKGHRTVRKGTGALLRQLYLLEHKVETPFDFPGAMMNKLTPLQYELRRPHNGILSSNSFCSSLHEFLEGRSLFLLEQLVEIATGRGLIGEYIGRLILKDCESLRRLFDCCLHRNFRMKEALGIGDRLIPQDKLDDYLIRATFFTKKFCCGECG